MVINGVELEDIDILDLETAERYERALEGVEGVAEKVDGMKTSESIRTQCKAIFNVFNELFGEGTDRKVFGDKVNLLTSLKAFEELILQVESKSSEAEKFINKYSPDRAKRRSKK